MNPFCFNCFIELNGRRVEIVFLQNTSLDESTSYWDYCAVLASVYTKEMHSTVQIVARVEQRFSE